MLLIDHFEATARDHPERLFLHFVSDAGDTQLTYREANRLASSFARQLVQLGIGRGDVVAMLMTNEPEWLSYHFANQKLGVTTTTLNTELRVEELSQLVTSAGVIALLHSPALVENAQAIQAKVREATGRQITLVDTHAAVGADDSHLPRDAAITATDHLSIVFTSGTSGSKSKGVIASVGNVSSGVEGYMNRLELGSEDRIMLVTPLFHASALHWGVGMAISCGGTIVLADRFSRRSFWDQAQRSGATVIWTMGAILLMLLTDPTSDAERQAMKKIRVVFGNGGAPRRNDFVRRWGPIFFDGYGSSETFGTLTDDDCFDTGEPYTCTGRLVPGVSLGIQDPETGRELPVGEIGEIVSPFGSGFAGYVDDAAATAESIRNGWFRTGDLGFFDNTGRLFFVDRVKDIIRRAGENIAAREVEQILQEMPGVAEVVAVAKPDIILGEVVAVYIVPEVESRHFDLEEVQAFSESRLASYKWPQEVLNTTASLLPRTHTGKIKKGVLKQQLRERALSEGNA